MSDLVVLGGEAPSLLGSSVISSHLRSLGHPEKAIRSLERCQEDTGGFYFQWCDCGHKDKVSSLKHWCSNRTCAPCARKRQQRLRYLYLDSLQKLPQTKNISLRFLTISPLNYEDLQYGLKDIRKNFSKFIRRNYIKKNIYGSIYVIEAKQNFKGQKIFDEKTGIYLFTIEKTSWNIHIHAIIYSRFLENRIVGKCNKCGQKNLHFNPQTKTFSCFAPRCLSSDVTAEKNSRLVSEWMKSTNNQPVNIHITRQLDRNTKKNIPAWTLNYMLKYIGTNDEDFKDEESKAYYIYSTYKTKLLQTTGIFQNYLWEKTSPTCEHCGSKVSFITSHEIDYLTREAERLESIREAKRQMLLREEKFLLIKSQIEKEKNASFVFTLTLDCF